MKRAFIFSVFFTLLIILITSTLSCRPAITVRNAPVPVPSLVMGNLELLVMSPDKTTPELKDDKQIILKAPLQPASELKHYWDGKSVFFGSPKDGAEYTEFGQRGYREMLFKGNKNQLNSFVQNKGNCFCVIDQTLYQEIDGSAVAIAECKFRSYTSEDGKEHRAQMTRRLAEGETWHFIAESNKVFSQDEKGSVKQVGWIEWKIAVMPSGEKALILMARSMDDNSLWTGEHEGKVYTGRQE